ncbi:hypothetical protein PF004_g14843 [Phytophthora fragariae]|uniref:Geranylgeranyl transferase type-2 subunit alpha n=1 Tax=Phytophthora fragariae TaxID=53985 RepID=A0A6G0NN04_9STRA|nr:hypothetical protein PF004_g14843 [Phytophthora fragariae]
MLILAATVGVVTAGLCNIDKLKSLEQHEHDGRRAWVKRGSNDARVISPFLSTLARNAARCMHRMSFNFSQGGLLDAQDEAKFTNLVFTLQPKSIDAWAYRRWLAIRLCDSLSEDNLRVFFDQQIEVCSRLAEQKPRNYHAWSFRHWIVSRPRSTWRSRNSTQ